MCVVPMCPDCGRSNPTLIENGRCRACGHDFLAEKRLALDPRHGSAFGNIPPLPPVPVPDKISVEDLESFLAGRPGL